MKKYVNPQIKVSFFATEEILTASSGWSDEGAGSTDNGGNVDGTIIIPSTQEGTLAF